MNKKKNTTIYPPAKFFCIFLFLFIGNIKKDFLQPYCCIPQLSTKILFAIFQKKNIHLVIRAAQQK